MNKKHIEDILFLKKIMPLIAVFLLSYTVLCMEKNWQNQKHFERGLCINEVCRLSYGFNRLTGANCGYIELYNPTSEEINLDEYYVTNDKKKIESKVYLKGLSIKPGSYLILKTDGEVYQEGENHIPILLDDERETIYLLNSSGVVVDSTEQPELAENISYFREEDGSSNWRIGESTPGISNENSMLSTGVNAPQFSLESGFYQKGSYLSLFLDNGANEIVNSMIPVEQEGKDADIKIIYTIDGSMPSVDNGIEYSEPINLDELSKRKNLYANRADVSTGFLEKQIKEAEQIAPKYAVPDDTLDKAVVIRAAAINKISGSISQTITKSYFVDYESKTDYANMPIVSLVTDPENLFDYYTGIYITGDFWDRTGPNEQPWEFWYTNYNQTGPSWERLAQVEYFNEKHTIEWRQNLGISIRGLSSRAYAQKGFRLHARNEIDGNNYITYPFFEENEELETLQLSNAGNDTDTKLKDYLMSMLISDRGFSNPQMIPCVLFLNGEYWGMYYISQNYDESYIHSYYGVNEDDVIIIKNGDVKEGTAKDLQEYHEFEQYVIHTDFSIEENYQELCRKMDIQSYLDYYCAQIYISRKRDWPHTNFALWKSRTIGEGEFADGRWRWMLFDVNTEEGELEEYLVAFDTIAEVDFHNEMFHALMQIPEVKKQFVITMMDLYNGYFRAENVLPIIDRYENDYETAVLCSLERFYGDNKGQEEFQIGMNSIRNFFLNRKEYLFSYMITDLGLNGEVANVVVQTNLQEAGRVEINTLDVEFDNGNWQGYYFTDYPIVLNATPKEGYVFVGWDGDVESTENQIEVGLDSKGVEIRAIYQKIQTK